ncbi:MAG: hypothetical protein CME68_00710 [Halobacteriovoraceae bacterium]|nr:hypothetical protein [Halobacteriovoraceae bacterium]|tara:strand:+ start:239 stop:616 length:378 start_codon:yes stop_codon:yes gene_type:complete
MKRKILVFDDDDGTGGVVANIFSDSDVFEVVVPDSHYKGVSLLKSSLFSIIVTDFEMPVMKGSEFLKEIRNENCPNREVPILFVTKDVAKAKKSSGPFQKVYFADKPIIISELMMILKKVTGEGF